MGHLIQSKYKKCTVASNRANPLGVDLRVDDESMTYKGYFNV